MNKQKLFKDLISLETDCRVLKHCGLNDDLVAKLDHMQLTITGLLLEVKKK